MNVGAPSLPFVVISIILLIVAVLSRFNALPLLWEGGQPFWSAVASSIVLLVGCFAGRR